MKKIIFGGIAIVAIAVAIAFSLNVKTTESGLSDLALSNVEALATKLPPPMECYTYCPFLTPGYICHLYTSSGPLGSCPGMNTTWY